MNGNIAVITGASAGIGLAVAHGLAAEGCDLLLCARDSQRLEQAAEAVRQRHGVRVVAVPADVGTRSDVDRVVEAISRNYGGADILINNAGTGSEETILDASDERWQHYWDLHVMAAVRLSRALAPMMRERGGGVILNNASICATQPLGHEPIYNVTKAALVMFSKCLANELIPFGIRVNALNAGLVRTQSWEDAAKRQTGDAGWESWLDTIAREQAPIGRFASPEEIADFMVFLCSARASYCVGSSYYVDGGWLNVVT
ncbi:SDR family NAD(P)-dependent oxidoreductase [Deinococcus sonorensis]